jgi:IS5 family transposase
LEFPLLRTATPPLTTWDDLLPDQATRLPAELARVEAYLDDERFSAPWRAYFSARLGRPWVPIPTLLRLLYLKHRYGLGYETSAARLATRSRGAGSAASRWTRPCRTPPPSASWCAGLARR